MKNEELLKLAISSGNAEIVKLILKEQDIEKSDKKERDFQNTVRNVIELIEPISGELTLENIVPSVNNAFKGRDLGYYIDTEVINNVVTADLIIYQSNGFSKKWNHIEIPVKVQDGDKAADKIQLNCEKARLISMIQGFNLVQASENISLASSDSNRLSAAEHAQVIFPTMTQRDTEQTREETEENIHIIADNRGMKYEDAFNRLCNEIGLKSSCRRNFSLAEWKALNKKAQSFLRC